MGPIKFIMGDIIRLRKLLMLITSVLVEIQLNLSERSKGHYLKGNNMAQIKIYNGSNVHAQISNNYNSNFS